MAADMAEMAPKEIIKEGLSEYFIYTIEAPKPCRTAGPKRLRSFEADAVPMTVEYRYRPVSTATNSLSCTC